MPEESRDTHPNLGPYRTPEAPPPGQSSNLPWLVGIVSMLGLICGVAMIHSCDTDVERPGIAEIPKDLLGNLEAYPPPVEKLPRATPLAPLLVANQPDALAVLSPHEGATRLRRGRTLRIRFNRPMVEGREVDRELEELPISFDPPIPGTAEWTSRSTLLFRPAPEAWTTDVRESQLRFEGEMTSLDGSVLADEYERVIVLDGAPRVERSRSRGRVNAGSPLPLYFDAPVSAGTLRDELLAYEIGGGQRSLPFQLSSRGEDPQGDFRVDIQLRKTLEPGARVGLALTPRYLDYGSRPGIFEYEMTPPPQIEGIDCPSEAYSAHQCTYTESPGRIVDIGPELRLLSSAPLVEPDPALVTIIPPLPKMRVALAEQGYAKARRLKITGEWTPNLAYEVRVGALRTADGRTLRPLAPLAVRSAGHTPAVQVATGRRTWESDAEPVIHFAAINPEKGQVRYHAVEEGRELDAVLAPETYLGAGDQAFALAPLAPNARPNRWGRGQIHWRDDEERAADMAVVGFFPSIEQSPSSARVAFVQSTDLGITLRGSLNDLAVWVTSLSENQPVTGAEVVVADQMQQTVGRGRTDGDGLAVIELPASSPLRSPHAVRVVAGDDRAVLVLDPRRAVAPYGMGLEPGEQGGAADRSVAAIFADRGAYRPGESLHAKVTLRQVADDQATAVVDQDIVVKLFTPSDTAPLAVQELQTNRWGTADLELDLPNSAPLGEYSILAYLADEQSSLGETTIEVSQFRQPTFRVDLEVPEGDLHEGDSVTFMVSGTYLFGAPVADAELSWSMVRRGVEPMPQRWSEYRFASVEASTPSGTIDSGDLNLDAEGRAEVSAQLSLGAARRGRVTVEAEVTDSAGHTYAARETVAVYPADHEVGLRQGDDWVALDEELDLEAILIDHEGELAGGQEITARIVREGWHSWWEWSTHARSEGPLEGEGFRLRRNRRAQEVSRCELTTSDVDPVHCTHTPAEPGTYLLEVTYEDEQGRQSTASRRVYVAGPDEHPDRDPPGAPIEVTPTQRRWQVGDTAELAFEAPWGGGQALITVEREGVISSERREIEAGGQVIRLPITAQMVPNVFVGVTLVRPRTAAPEEEVDLDAPDLRFGVTELQIQPATSHLEVDLDLGADEARSGEQVPITVLVTDADGQPAQAEVALWAVDEGTLRLTDYQVPNPTSGVFRRRPAAFAWDDLRRSLVSRIEPPPMPLAGGDGRRSGESDSLPPEGEAFDPTPLWLAHLETGPDGRVSANFDLPHRETEYRVMAVALDEGIRWGRAEQQLVASQPVVLRAAFPRFVRAGDTFRASVFVHNTTEEAMTVRVTSTIAGDHGEPQVIELEPGAEQRVSQQVTAPQSGPMELRFEAEGGGYRARAVESLSVQPAGRFVRSSVIGGDEPGDWFSIGLPEGTPSTGGEVILTVASHPFLGFEGAVAALEDSYWFNTDALASTLLGMAAYAELGVIGRPGSWSTEELRARGERVARELLDLQNYEGGFGYWRSGEISNPRVTAYAFHALQRAHAAGIPVPEPELERIRDHLADLARSSFFGDAYSRHSPDNLAFALRALADAGLPQPERAGAQYEHRDRLSPYGEAQLAIALGDDPRADTLVTNAIETVLTDREDEQQDPSRLRWRDRSARVYGAVLEAASRVEVGQRSASELARRLLAIRDGYRGYPWGTALETSQALTGLATYARLFEVPESERPRVSLGARDLEPVAETPDAAIYEIPFDQLPGQEHNLTIESGDGGPVFYAIDGRWAVPLGVVDEVARGRTVALHRVFETEDGRRLEEGAEVPLGAMVRVRLFVYSEGSSPPMIALHDPTAAGLEAVDSTLDTSPRDSLEALFGMGPNDEAGDPRGHIAMRSLSNIAHRSFDTAATTFYLSRLRYGLNEYTYAVRATTEGEFVIPPAQIEALYEPEFVGRSAAGRLRVVAP